MEEGALAAEVESARYGNAVIKKSDVLRWMRDAHLEVRARVYELTATQWSRIEPEIGMEEQCRFMADYLLDCIATNPHAVDDFVHKGFEAGHALHHWLKHLVTTPDAAPIISSVAKRLAELYRSGDEHVRTRIEQGALEHILEKPALRPFFSYWNDDPILREAYEPALKWGLAHTERS